MNTNTARIGVIGAGRLGSCLALALARSGQPVSAIASPQHAHAAELAARVGGVAVLDPEQVVRECELVLLTVPDAQIAVLAARLPWNAGQAVVHCSGAVDLSALDAVREAGGLRGCWHPLQSFPERFGEPERFAGIACGVEADAELGARLEAYCHTLGAAVFRLEGVDRAAYHAAAVFASNYLVALHVAAEEAWASAGLSRQLARAALAPLTLGAAQQIARLPLEAALTGPLARGDRDTIAAHLSALSPQPALRDLYLRLAQLLIARPIALSDAQRAEVLALLSLAERDRA